MLDSLSSLEAMLKYMKEYNMSKALEANKLVYEYEKDADTIHRSNVEKVCKGAIFGYLREDLLRFMELVDNIADAAKEAATTLTIRDIPNDLLADFLNEQTMHYVNVSVETARELANLIRSLEKKREEILKHTKVIEEHEEESDTLKHLVFKELYSSSKYDILTLLQFKEFIHLIDAIADNSEDASDVILIMIAKGYS